MAFDRATIADVWAPLTPAELTSLRDAGFEFSADELAAIRTFRTSRKSNSQRLIDEGNAHPDDFELAQWDVDGDAHLEDLRSTLERRIHGGMLTMPAAERILRRVADDRHCMAAGSWAPSRDLERWNAPGPDGARPATYQQLRVAVGDALEVKCVCRACKRTLGRIMLAREPAEHVGEFRPEWWRVQRERGQADRVEHHGGADAVRYRCKCGRDIPVSAERMASELERAERFRLRTLTF